MFDTGKLYQYANIKTHLTYDDRSVSEDVASMYSTSANGVATYKLNEPIHDIRVYAYGNAGKDPILQGSPDGIVWNNLATQKATWQNNLVQKKRKYRATDLSDHGLRYFRLLLTSPEWPKVGRVEIRYGK